MLVREAHAHSSSCQPSFAMFLAPSAPAVLATLSPSDSLESQLLHRDFFLALDFATSLKEPVHMPANVERGRRGGNGQDSHKHNRHQKGAVVLPFAMQVCTAALSKSWDSFAHLLTLGNLLDSLCLGRMAT